MEKKLSETPEQYFEREYGKGHIESVIGLNDMISLYGLMEEYGSQCRKEGFDEGYKKANEDIFKIL